MASELIETTDHLASYLQGIVRPPEPPLCAIDTEADSLHRYRESLCLIQFARDEDCLLIDPLAIDDLAPLGSYLRGATVWMHGADYDMTMLKREFGEVPAMVYDTQIGARLLGARRFGLADLVSEYFGIELSKTSQKADWGKRPLPDKMVEYALNDVRYLLPMGETIVSRLRELDRYEWFEESCRSAMQRVMERDDGRDEAWRIQGSGKLDPRGLAALRAVWHWRDLEASQWDRPTFMVATNRQLLEWAEVLASGGRLELPGHFRPDRVKRFREAVDALRAQPKSAWPEKVRGQRRRRDKDFDRLVESLLKKRDSEAARLEIEGSLIASRAVIETIAADEATPEELLLGWQRSLLGLAS